MIVEVLVVVSDSQCQRWFAENYYHILLSRSIKGPMLLYRMSLYVSFCCVSLNRYSNTWTIPRKMSFSNENCYHSLTPTESQNRPKRTRWLRATLASSLAPHWWSHSIQMQRCLCPHWWITPTRHWWWSSWWNTFRQSLMHLSYLVLTQAALARPPPDLPRRRRFDSLADTQPPWLTSKRWGGIKAIIKPNLSHFVYAVIRV